MFPHFFIILVSFHLFLIFSLPYVSSFFVHFLMLLHFSSFSQRSFICSSFVPHFDSFFLSLFFSFFILFMFSFFDFLHVFIVSFFFIFFSSFFSFHWSEQTPKPTKNRPEVPIGKKDDVRLWKFDFWASVDREEVPSGPFEGDFAFVFLFLFLFSGAQNLIFLGPQVFQPKFLFRTSCSILLFTKVFNL